MEFEEDDISVEDLPWEVSVAYKCHYCGFFESRSDSLYNHTFEEHSSKTFYCHICSSKTFKSIPELSFHIENTHGITYNLKFACPLCLNYFFHKEDEFNDHIVRDHWSVKPVQACSLCSYKCENNIEDHINNNHKGFNCKIYKCNFMADNELKLLEHTLSFHLPELKMFHSCIMCEREFINWDAARKHLSNSHSVFLDDNPHKYITNIGAIENCKEVDLQETKYLKLVVQIHCKLCTYICQKRSRFINHMENRHSNFKYKCSFKKCNFRNNKFWIFCRHVSINHLLDTKFACPHCKQKFPTLKLGFSHNYAAHGKNKAFFTKVYSCNICQKEVTDRVDDYSHFSSHHSIDFPKEIALLFTDNESGLAGNKGDLLDGQLPSSQSTSPKPSENTLITKAAGLPSVPPRPVKVEATRKPVILPSRPTTVKMTSNPPVYAPRQTTYIQASQPTTSATYSSYTTPSYTPNNRSYQPTYSTYQNNSYQNHGQRRKKKDDCCIL